MCASNYFVDSFRRAAVLFFLLLMATVTYAQITPSDDAYVNSAAPTTNYGSSASLNLSSAADTDFIRFDLTAVPASYTGASIAKATLKLYVHTVTTAGSFNVDLVNGTWTEETIQSSNEPALGTTIVAAIPLTTTSKLSYVEIDITPALVKWLNGTQPNDGIALVANSPLVATFDSKENTTTSHPPELDIVYVASGSLTGVTTASGSGLIGGGTSGTLNLSLTDTCANGQVLQWNGTVWVCATGGFGSVTSVGFTAPSTDFMVTGSPIRTSGTLGLAWLVAPDTANTANAIVKRDGTGSFTAGTINAANGFNLGGTSFAFGTFAAGNAFLGFSGNFTSTGTNNTANGQGALLAVTAGSSNTADGRHALLKNTTGGSNTAVGNSALSSNTTGGGNTAQGDSALASNTTGGLNTAIGESALFNNTTGSYTTALGYLAGPDLTSPNLTNATALGAFADVTQSNALVLGSIFGVNTCTAQTNCASVNVGIGTTAPQYTLDVHGTGNFTGLVKFASGQAFPGTGTVTGITAGTDLSGGGTSGNVTLNVDTTKVVTGISAGTDLTGGGTGGVLTLNLDTTKVPQLATANTFATDQTVNGNLVATSVTGTVAVNGGVVNALTAFYLAGTRFAFGAFSQQNAFLGYAGSTTTKGTGNVATGYQALTNNPKGSYNVAVGYQALASNNEGNTGNTGTLNVATGSSALFSNTTGSQNTASGNSALFSNTTGSGNTAIGSGALATNTTGSGLTCIGENCTVSTSGLTNATAIGAYATVGASNSLILGGTGEWGVMVGIGTSTPSNVLTIAQGAGQPVSDGWATFSSRRWKTNIHTLHDALAKVEQLRGVSYDLKANGQHEVGVIAEEVGAVVPEVVTWEKNGADAQSVDYGRLTALLIEATKEQQALIQQQKEQIREQQAQIVQLTREVKTIQATLKSDAKSRSAVRAVKVEGTTVRQ
jgi:trimeric autotransporter adhesin